MNVSAGKISVTVDVPPLVGRFTTRVMGATVVLIVDFKVTVILLAARGISAGCAPEAALGCVGQTIVSDALLVAEVEDVEELLLPPLPPQPVRIFGRRINAARGNNVRPKNKKEKMRFMRL